LIASDDFYHGVIVNDPAADPPSYRQIHVSFNESSTLRGSRSRPALLTWEIGGLGWQA
jgi:hypothetical protein